MQKLGILFFADRLPPLIGGMEMHAKYFTEYFTTHSRFPILSIITKNAEGQDCIILNKETKPINLNKLDNVFNPVIIFFNSGRWIEDLKQLRNIFPKTKFIYRTGGNEILKASLISGKMSEYIMRRSYWVDILNDTVDLLITNSTYTENRLSKIGIKCPFKRFVGGVNISALKAARILDNKPFTIFCAARFVPYKNHSLMISLVHELVLRGYSFKLRLAGEGSLLEQIKGLVDKNDLSSVVEFLGVLENEKICEEIINADIYMQLSCDKVTEVPGGSYIHSEGMGRSILEALTAGTFIIAGNSGALPEVITADRGLLVNFNDFQQIVNQVEQILKYPQVRKPLDDKFCWLKIFKGYEELFKDISNPIRV
ncbi:glycosyltransferase family 4 protein [Candidatus Tisiphia endosymbiont of Myopa tessellatipennis]|uniref:glycosyltransferase family 4 protein n=1 Tax=Candidatus Tisiphia endosymbiont of Myopa tessellatipennis TaxID=3066257 RepID=UPI00313CC4E3